MYPDYAFFPEDPLFFFYYDGIIKLINNMKIYCSCGVDNITSKFLKYARNYVSSFISKSFEQFIGK